MKWAIYMFSAMFLIMMSGVIAVDSIGSILGEVTPNYENNSIDVRYDVLICNIDYTIEQVDTIEEYANDLNANLIEELIDDTKVLKDDKEELKNIYDEDNITKFNKFVSETLIPNHNTVISGLNDFDDDYEEYIDSNDRDEFHDELLDVQDDHRDCIVDALDNNTTNDDDNSTSDDDDDNSTSDDDTDYVGRSLDLRYENLICKIDFTIGQIDVTKEYTNDTDADIIDELLDDKEELVDDKNDLKEVYDDKNVTEFNDFVIDILHPDFNDSLYDLKEFKDNYKSYIDEEDRDDFKNALIALKDEYNDCTDVRYTEMSKLMDKYYKHKSGMWDQVIKSMNQRGLGTHEMEDVKEQLEDRLDELEDAINSGNLALIKEQMDKLRAEHTQLWAKFHSGRLNSYLNRIEPAANKYGRSDDVKQIRMQLDRLKNLSDDDKENAKKVWSELKNNADDMKEMGKGMLKQKNDDKNKGNGRSR